MDLAALTISLAVFIGAWYSLATVLGRRINANAARRCAECNAKRFLATGTSYLVEMECGWAKYVGVFVQRLPWDNPFNLAASLLARRRPLALVKIDVGKPPPWSFDMSAKGALGPAERVGGCYVVGRAVPKALLTELADACAKLDIARVSAGGRYIEIYIPSDNCNLAIQISKTIVEILEKYIKK